MVGRLSLQLKQWHNLSPNMQRPTRIAPSLSLSYSPGIRRIAGRRKRPTKRRWKEVVRAAGGRRPARRGEPAYARQGARRQGLHYRRGFISWPVYEHGMPVPGKRHFSLTIPGLPTGKPGGENQIVHNDELVSGEIGQIGTQFDGLGHIGVTGGEDLFYNGKLEFGDTYGLKS
jgi:hypothetical protein